MNTSAKENVIFKNLRMQYFQEIQEPEKKKNKINLNRGKRNISGSENIFKKILKENFPDVKK